MGASPLTKSSSGIPMGFLVSGDGFMISATHRSPNSLSKSSDGFPEAMDSSG